MGMSAWWLPAEPATLGLRRTGAVRRASSLLRMKSNSTRKNCTKNGLKIISVATRRINASALPPAVKSLNYLNNILAKIEAKRVGFQEALMLNDKGEIAECTGDNVFILSKGVIFTPPLDAGSLRGITRAAVMDLAMELGFEVKEQALTRYDLWTAEECFLTGTAAEVIPCVEVDHRVIGSGKPGEATQALIGKFREKVKKDGVFL